MKTVEHDIELVSVDLFINEHRRLLDKKAFEGFELVQIIQIGNVYAFYFKKVTE